MVNPLAIDTLVAMRHEELRRLRGHRYQAAVTSPAEAPEPRAAHRVCGTYIPAVNRT